VLAGSISQRRARATPRAGHAIDHDHAETLVAVLGFGQMAGAMVDTS
jgi:hypothetical protein